MILSEQTAGKAILDCRTLKIKTFIPHGLEEKAFKLAMILLLHTSYLVGHTRPLVRKIKDLY